VTYPSIPFRFACICYRDPVDQRNNIHEQTEFSDDINKLKTFLNGVKAWGGYFKVVI
jgi:hypothetical protein